MSFYGGNLENDCIAILNWCYRNQNKKPCSRECKRIYAQAQEKPIRYNIYGEFE